MMIQTKVSVCLPTRNRPELLIQCLESCLKQTHSNIEVVIGDDSTDDLTQKLLASEYRHEPRIQYVRNDPPLGQARNINSLFSHATGDKILLIHDDDCLVANGVERLLALWEANTDLDVAFGDQYEFDETGHVDLPASDRLNKAYYRTESAEGIQKMPGRTGLVQMFPNNGWMANATLVKQVGYKEQYGLGCEYVFGVELCLLAKRIHYVKQYISFYRITTVSISQATRGSTSAAPVLAYAFVSTLKLDSSLESARRVALRRLVPIAVSAYSRNRAPIRGLRIALNNLFAYNYGWSMRFYYHLILMVTSRFSR